MTFFYRLLKPLHRAISRIDCNSIQFRLTAGILLASALGIGSITAWTTWRMQQILLEGQKQSAIEIAERFGEDVALYQEMMPLEAAIQQVIDYRTTGDLAIWLKSADNQVLARSQTLALPSWQAAGVTEQLLALERSNFIDVYAIENHYWVICAGPLEIADNPVGILYVANDITQAQRSFLTVVRSLSIAGSGVLLAIALVIALAVRRSLRPIRQLNQLAANVSISNLNDTQLQLDQAPTEVQQLAQTCNMMLSRLSDAWMQQRRFVSDVSHELRTPLTLINGYLQSTLRRCQTLTEPQREGLEIATAETERTIRLLQDLLDLARTESGSLRFALEVLDLQEVVREVVEMADYGNQQVQVKAETLSLLARVDRSRLKQILINLIDNAVKYSSPGEIVVVKLIRSDKQAQIQVIDRGRGIPLCDQTAIFEPFYRVDEDRSRATGGTGLGLSIVKRLAEGMGGQVKVYSKLGEGSRFTVCFPIA
ncbi:sensor histidine kinase [Sphaerothrix gracilis]|uniref:sensor histidine kinase n=1 Tax=Sphaerothrix gracilis TaxID=3151835 RepID=UPI0031FC1607